MKKDIYYLDMGTDCLLVDINTLEHIKVSKKEFAEKEKIFDICKRFKSESQYIEHFLPVPDEKIINPTLVTSFRCNYQCSYCYQRDKKRQEERLLPDDISLIMNFYEVYCQRFSFPLEYGTVGIIGGEPLLPENREIIDKIADEWKGHMLQVTTNGTYILEYADFIRENKVKFKVSVDGTKDTHLKERVCHQPNAYERTWKGISFLMEYDVPTVIMTVFNPDHVDDYPAFFDLLENRGWLKNPDLSVAFIPQIGYGCDDIEKDYLLNSLEALKKLRDLDYRTKYVNAGKMVPGAVNLRESLLLAERGFYTPYRCENMHMPDFCFLPDGKVYLCLGMMSNELGCIGRFKPEIEIYHDKIKMFEQRRMDTSSKCMGCDKKVFCQGGCPATALHKTDMILGHACELWEQPDFLEYLELVL